MDGTINWKTVAFTTPGQPAKVSDIRAAAALHFRVSEADIKGPSKRKELARARQVVCFLARELTAASLPMIGRELGDRDHTTVLWGCRKIKKLMGANAEGMVAHVQNVRELVLSGNPRAALSTKNAEARRRAEARLAEADAEAAIRHSERMRQFRRIQANAVSGGIPAGARAS